MSRSTTRTLRRLALAAGAALAGRSILRRRQAMQVVPPDLRSPILWVPLSFSSDRTVRMIRSLAERAPAIPSP